MITKVIAFALELGALVVLISAFAASPIHWEFVAGGIALFGAGLAVRKRFGAE